VELWECFRYNIVSSSKTSSFPIWIYFISSSCLIALARNCKIIMNKSAKREHPCLILDFSGNYFCFTSFSLIMYVHMHAYPLLIYHLLYWSTSFLFLVFLPILSWNDVQFWKIVLQLFRWSYDFFLASIYVLHYIYWVAYVKPFFYPWKKTIWSWCIRFLCVV
jgi:hypothetical protein